ncbi:MAG: thioredoxin domain-containing protein [Pseudomonadota bacterium]
MIKYIAPLLCLFIISCSDKTNDSTSAQSHIDEYNAKNKQHEEVKDSPKEEVTSITKTTSEPNSSVVAPLDGINDSGGIFAIDEHDIVLGNPKAPVVVIEYSSPTCAHCAYFHKSIFPELKKNYVDTGKIAYVIREFITNKQDLDATILASCKGDKDHFVKMLDIFLSQQESWAFNTNYRDVLTNIGQLSGITPEEYAKCLNDEELLERAIGRSRAISRVPGFIGTPSFVIDGALNQKAYSYQNLSNAIDEAATEAEIKSKTTEKVEAETKDQTKENHAKDETKTPESPGETMTPSQ